MARVARAQARGKTNVKLGKEELAAYQKKLALMEYQKQRPQRRERVAVPITALGPASRSTKRLVSGGSTPPSTSSLDPSSERDPGPPPMGYFPPSSSRSLPRSGSSSSRTPSQTRVDRDRDLSPFTYSYIRKGDPEVRSTARQLSDSSDYQSLSRGPQPRSDSSDPFQYMTGDKQLSPHSGASASSRTLHLDPVAGAPYYGSSTVVRRRTGGHEDSGSGSEDAFDPARPARVNSSGSARPDSKGDDKSSPPAKKLSSSSAAPTRKKSVATRTSILGTTRRKAK
ncbi:hypothetical protein B0T21DRAFT_370020 [Apiosordaria backusii]|uniref:Uncharacterized protein n=1 Tax=Apiosordaria backusii TaxID=314023 RepID=A0AA40EB43_9PEZI|nr:hypothetical protein B0T21DRAFT_370020 [Apiosordaria backusii]